MSETTTSALDSNTAAAQSQDPRTLKQQDVVQKMIEDFLGDKSGRFPKNHSARIAKIVEFNDRKFGNTDPFYNAEVNKARMYNGGVIDDVDKLSYAFVEVFPQQTLKMVENILVNIDHHFKSDSENYLLLPRVDLTGFEKKFKESPRVGHELIVDFEKQNKSSNLKIVKVKEQKTEDLVLKHPGTITVGGEE